MTAVAGVFFAFYYNSLFPEQIFSFGRSIEIMLGPVIGGLGTLFGPIVGAAALVVLGDGTTEILTRLGIELPGVKQVDLRRAAAGRGRLSAARHLAAAGAGARLRGDEALTWRCSQSRSQQSRSAVCARWRARPSRSSPSAITALIGPNGAGKTTLFNLVAGRATAGRGEIHLQAAAIGGLRPDQVCAAGVGRTFQLVKPFAGLSVLDNVIVGALRRERTVAGARARARAHVLERLGLGAEGRRSRPRTLTLADRRRLEVARALATRPRCCCWTR